MTRPVGDVAAFLAARLDEDEAAAVEAIQETTGRWDASKTDWNGGSIVKDECGALILHASGRRSTQYRHIARHDPARALREVAAKRAILKLATRAWRRYQDELDVDGWPKYHDGALAEWREKWDALEPALRHLASIYSDHPDYDPAWAPG